MVKETNADQGGFTTTSEGEEGTISEGGATAKFTNTRGVSTLTVSKTVDGAQGETGDPNKPWNFTVTMKDGETPLSGTFACVGTQTSLTFQAGQATFSLKHGQSITIKDIPVWVAYQVTEQGANTGGYEMTSTNATGTIQKDIAATAAFTNTKVPPVP